MKDIDRIKKARRDVKLAKKRILRAKAQREEEKGKIKNYVIMYRTVEQR